MDAFYALPDWYPMPRGGGNRDRVRTKPLRKGPKPRLAYHTKPQRQARAGPRGGPR